MDRSLGAAAEAGAQRTGQSCSPGRGGGLSQSSVPLSCSPRHRSPCPGAAPAPTRVGDPCGRGCWGCNLRAACAAAASFFAWIFFFLIIISLARPAATSIPKSPSSARPAQGSISSSDISSSRHLGPCEGGGRRGRQKLLLKLSPNLSPAQTAWI